MTVATNCPDCRGFGYIKGGPSGPWEKLDCTACGGKGKVQSCKHPQTSAFYPFGDVCTLCGEPVPEVKQ